MRVAPHPYRRALEARDPEALAESLHPDGEGTHAVAFRLSVEGHPLEGIDHLLLDADGRVRQITVSMRPLASLEVLAGRMAETHANLTGRG